MTPLSPRLWNIDHCSPSRVLSTKIKAGVTTVHRNNQVLELRNAISRNLAELRRSQRIYMPGLVPTLDDIRDDSISEDSLKLYLPSEIPPNDRDAWCHPGLPSLEFLFRFAQADDSLAEIRRLRRLLQGLRDQNTKHPFTSQRSISRSAGIFNGLTAKIQRFAERYSHARRAMLRLDPGGKLVPGWKKRFEQLNDSDLRGPGRELFETSEGRFTPSWIWLVPVLDRLPQITTPLTNPDAPPPPTHENETAVAPMIEDPVDTPATPTSENPTDAAATPMTGNTANTSATPTTDIGGVNEDLLHSMRAHWAKCQARAERYEEEVILTIEEMGRTLRYLEWKQDWWISLGPQRLGCETLPPDRVQRGLVAYAQRQASVYEVLAASFVGRWRKTLFSHGREPDWLSQYIPDVDPPSRPSRGHSQKTTKSAAGSTSSGSAQAESALPPQSQDETSDEAIDSPIAGGEESGSDEIDIIDAEPLDFDD